MIEAEKKEDLFLNKKLIIPENRLDNLRIIDERHAVVGGQPTHEKNQPNDNNTALDIVCTLANIHASGVGDVADLRVFQNEPPSYWLGRGSMWGISSLRGNGVLHVIGGWFDEGGIYAIKQFYYTEKGVSYRSALSATKWGEWIPFAMGELEYGNVLNVPITSTLSDHKDKIASIYAVNQVNKATITAQKTANTADSKAATAQNRANSAYNNAATAQTRANSAYNNASTAQTRANSAYNNAATAQTRADSAYNDAATAKTRADGAYIVATNAHGRANTAYNLAGTAKDRADDAFSRIKPISEGGTGATNVQGARNNLGLGQAATWAVATSLNSNRNTLVPLHLFEQLFGVDQDWVDVKNSRSINTTYRNDTKRPIAVSIDISTAVGDIRVTNRYGQWIVLNPNIYYGSFIIVPSGRSYRATTGLIDRWIEFR